MGAHEILSRFFCGPPYDSMLLITGEWFDVKGKQHEQPVMVCLRYRLDLKDVPPSLAEALGRACDVRTYLRSFELRADGIEAHRNDEDEDGTFYGDFRFFPMSYRKATGLMGLIAELDHESSSGDLWACAERMIPRSPRYAE
ncbi:hypothetical protein HY492_03635 [Candidatus Woesearchaeota archaeon]|nr:hypothetical protein [Candidatus Woesearchaeota archaeon]